MGGHLEACWSVQMRYCLRVRVITRVRSTVYNKCSRYCRASTANTANTASTVQQSTDLLLVNSKYEYEYEYKYSTRHHSLPLSWQRGQPNTQHTFWSLFGQIHSSIHPFFVHHQLQPLAHEACTDQVHCSKVQQLLVLVQYSNNTVTESAPPCRYRQALGTLGALGALVGMFCSHHHHKTTTTTKTTTTIRIQNSLRTRYRPRLRLPPSHTRP